MSDKPKPQYGGQAVIEGVMIRGAKHVCVACRELSTGADGKPLPPGDGPIFVDAETITTFAGRLGQRFPAARWPLIRGTLVLLESMELGTKGFRLSVSVALEGTRSGSLPRTSPAPPDAFGPDGSPRSTSPSVPSSAIAGAPAVDPLPARSPSPVSTPETVSKREAARRQRPVVIGLISGAAALLIVYFCFRLDWINGHTARILAVTALCVVAGVTALTSRANREEEQASGARQLGDVAVGSTMALGLVMGIAIFFLTPSLVAGAFSRLLHAPWMLNITEGLIRVALFFGYLKLISRMPNIHRLFQYHGAEHQIIHVHENGLDLTPENAARFPTIHPRCGTAFLAVVLVISVIVFSFAGWQALWERLILRLVLLPPVAGISYELLKWNSVRPNRVLKAFMAPGLWFQKITTQPPSTDQVEVAIAAMTGVLAREQEQASEEQLAAVVPVEAAVNPGAEAHQGTAHEKVELNGS